MKRARQNKILDLISRYEIDKQEELLHYLRESGFDVTQATVSRDIRELGLVKVSGGNGRYRYVSVAGGFPRPLKWRTHPPAHMYMAVSKQFFVPALYMWTMRATSFLSSAIPVWRTQPANCLMPEHGKMWWALWQVTTTFLF